MKKIKIVMILNNLDLNGISSVVMNYCTNINFNKFSVNILAGSLINPSYKNICENLGISIKELPSRKDSPEMFYNALFKELKRNNYDIAHIHGNSATITMELFLAWISGIKIRIAHIHNSTCNHMKINKLLIPLFNKLYTHGFACSTLAGNWLFKNKKYYVIPNGFDTTRFYFNLEYRKIIRKQLNLNDNNFLIGHVGRFNNQKNHPFLLKVFEQVAKKNSNVYLILVGNGPDFDKINQLINQHPYKNRIIVYGETTEIEKIYSAMDLFAFPSKYEGLGIVVLEAQISGLPCCISSSVPNDVIISDNINFIPINNDSIPLWCDKILYYTINNINRTIRNKINIKKFDIKNNVEYLENLYFKLLE